MKKSVEKEFIRQAKEWFETLEQLHGWSPPYIDGMKKQNGAYVFEIENETSHGQNVLQNLWINEADFEEAFETRKDLAFHRVANTALRELAVDYDPSEEASYWIDETGHGTNGAPHDLEEILEDMKEVKKLLEDSAADMLRIEDAGGRIPEIPEAAKNLFNIKIFDNNKTIYLTALSGHGTDSVFLEEEVPNETFGTMIKDSKGDPKRFLELAANHLAYMQSNEGALNGKYIAARFNIVKDASVFKEISENFGRKGVNIPYNGRYTKEQLEKTAGMIEPFVKKTGRALQEGADKKTQQKVGKDFLATVKKIKAEHEAKGKALSYTMLSKLAAKEVLESGADKKPALEAYLVSLGIDKIVKDTLEEKIEKAVAEDLSKPLSTERKGMTAEQKKIHRMMDGLFNESSFESPAEYVKNVVVAAGRSEIKARPNMACSQYWMKAVDHAVNSGGEMWHSTYDNEQLLKKHGIKFPKEGADRKYAECMKTYLDDVGALSRKTFERERDKAQGKSVSD